MKRMRYTLLLSMLGTFLLGSVSPALAQSYHAVVRTTNGGMVEGILLEVSVERVRLDPSGPVVLRVLPGHTIASVYIGEMDLRLDYPITKADIPPALASLESPRPNERAESSRTAPGGIRRFALVIGGGLVSTGKDEDYYEGITSGATLRAGFRYHFSEVDPRASRYFVGLSYNRSTPQFEPQFRSMRVGTDAQGRPILVTTSLTVHHYALEFGRTSRTSRAGSYLYALLGIAALNHVIAVEATVDRQRIAESTSDQKVALRCDVGGVLALTERIGIDLKLGFDALYGGQDSNPATYDASPVLLGWLPNVTTGIVIGL